MSLDDRQRGLVLDHVRFVPRRWGEDAYADGLLDLCEAALRYDSGRCASFRAFAATFGRQRRLDRNRKRVVKCVESVDCSVRDDCVGSEVCDAVEALPARQARAVRLRYLDGFSVRAVGSALGLGKTVTHEVLRRAEGNLRRMLA